MAKRKAAEKPKPKGRPAAAARLSATPIVTLKGTPEFAAWVARLAYHCRLTKSALVERALLLFAERSYFPEEPPHRQPDPGGASHGPQAEDKSSGRRGRRR